MDNRNAFERQLADEIDYEVGPPRNVDALAITRQAKTTSHRWRYINMSSPIKFAAAASILTVAGAAFFLVAPGGLTPDDVTVAPPGAEQPSTSPVQDSVEAAAEEPTGDESRYSQGLVRILSFPDFGVKTVPEDGSAVEELRGQVYEGIIESPSDPRLAGTLRGTLNQDSHLFPPDWQQPAVSQWGTERIENDGGAWECTWSGSETSLSKVTVIKWCVGEGGYEGYAAQMLLTKESRGGLDWEGLTWRGDLPPLPGPPQASAE
jgi:hypothetical protein